MIPQLFIDMDGVLADFYGFYETLFGVRLIRDTEQEYPPDLFDNIRGYGTFYRDQPLLPDALELWEGAKKFDPIPIILSGVPRSVPDVIKHKREWVDKYLGKKCNINLLQIKK